MKDRAIISYVWSGKNFTKTSVGNNVINEALDHS